ncbi:Cyclin-dependent kinase catalytic subunit [Exophiala xenobiotica]|uniref:Cyclin-dependent kinase catalytic subunit n=1 Tax=Lithohypha guttulata TaxID=1690604 RepID=A0ABR0KGQ8_9EURO|nr:Cyclin-dependent kinase catalytic subunit [Lithohypha guttulata]KAK5309741.1 Cyclin-dependent kinase catalytic subunit [Exophiala xenobiotica]
MEYFEHGDLKQCVPGALTEEAAQNITFQVTEALQFMHVRSFAHRDLKPSNIFVVQPAPKWWVKVADFGISKCHNDNTALHTLLTGDSEFAAPEIMGFTDDTTVTNAVDMWSLGCLVTWLTIRVCLVRPQDMFPFAVGRFTPPFEKLTASGVSQSGLDFVSRLLLQNPAQRLTAEAALEHIWLAGCVELVEFDDTLSISSRQPEYISNALPVRGSPRPFIARSVADDDDNNNDALESPSLSSSKLYSPKQWPRRGRTKMSKKKVHPQALNDLGYSFSEDESGMYVIHLALSPQNIDVVYERSQYHFKQSVHSSRRPLSYHDRRTLDREPPLARPWQGSYISRVLGPRMDLFGDVPPLQRTDSDPVPPRLTKRDNAPAKPSGLKETPTHQYGSGYGSSSTPHTPEMRGDSPPRPRETTAKYQVEKNGEENRARKMADDGGEIRKFLSPEDAQYPANTPEMRHDPVPPRHEPQSRRKVTMDRSLDDYIEESDSGDEWRRRHEYAKRYVAEHTNTGRPTAYRNADSGRDLSKIQALQLYFKITLYPVIRRFIESPPVNADERVKEYRQLSETVHQKIFEAGDAIEPVGPNADETRRMRKHLYNETHEILKELDRFKP